MRLIGHILPFENQPEYHSGKGRGVSIHLTFDGREPESITEGIDQGTYKTSSLDGDGLWQCQFAPVADEQPPREMGDTPE